MEYSTLNWEEREAGLPGQLPLPGFEDIPTPAERVFIRLARRWHDAYAKVDADHPPPRAVDEIALAALLLACECGASFTAVARQQITTNIWLPADHRAPWVDRLPWSLASAADQSQPGWSRECNELVRNLNHQNSQIRVWMMEIAWMVRPWLDRDAALPLLLENVASTLCGVQLAWGLAGALFDSENEFHAAAEPWQTEDFTRQYAERVELLKNMRLLATQAPFWRMEAACRRKIADVAMIQADAGRSKNGQAAC